MTNFSNWSQKRFTNWLRVNHPKPEGRYVEVTLNVHHAPGLIAKTTMADEYDTCIAELARELVVHNQDPWEPGHPMAEFPKAECTFLIRPAKRRRKKQMRLRTPPQ
jgi:hypothetical protein